MRILCISDTHSQHQLLGALPMADVLVHCGDVSKRGTESEVIDFMQWFCDQPHQYKIFIAGNHDLSLYGSNISGLPENCFYLNTSGVEIEGLHFYGIPLFVNDVVSGEYSKSIQSIPPNTDVLITHQPPHGILSSDYGDVELLERVTLIGPKLHLYGHAHECYGVKTSFGTHFVNAALLNNQYELTFKPLLIEL
ncbi:metallophosphatase domain-containing protein [Porphyromonadaceae bacterium W3.11]|nr:metallophosphatase domain-containing protein [Porphyromonadaceae bacterium W3.11]